ncbi:MAG: hypothetical protein FWE36_06860 [Erysipelotrichales bacterium]|nr:hypothetical protein [Erysipelotrichales bacterium]
MFKGSRIALSALMLCFVMLMSGCNSNRNEGRINGLANAHYSARYYTLEMHQGTMPGEETILISSLNELKEWHKHTFNEWDNSFDWNTFSTDTAKYLKQGFNNFLAQILENYLECFFENNQIILLPRLVARVAEWFAIPSINYYNSTLSINMRIRRPWGGMYDLGASSIGVIEISRISTDLNIELNISR